MAGTRQLGLVFACLFVSCVLLGSALLDDGFGPLGILRDRRISGRTLSAKPAFAQGCQSAGDGPSAWAEADAYLGPCVGQLADLALYAQTPPTPAEIEAAKAKVQEELARFEAHMTGPYLPGRTVLGRFRGLLASAPVAAYRRPQARQGYRQ